MANLQRMSQTSLASNYGSEILGDEVLHVRPDIPSSPYLLHPDREVPPIVLTKSHCVGYCDTCPNINAVHDVDSFELGCRKSFLDPEEMHHYPVSLVSKAVHIFRHPMDNLVSRKNLGIRNRIKSHPELWNSSEAVNDTREGFKAWCRYLDGEFANGKTGLTLLSNETRATFAGVPCASDLFLYVQWHNLAIQMTNRLQLPLHYLYYEDYSHDFNNTVRDLADFLGLDLVHPPIEFEPEKTYLDYFDDDEARAITAFVRRLATPECWQRLRRYLDRWALADGVQPKRDREIAILISFPNSGTTYTIENVERISNATTGVNYVKEVEPQEPAPVLPDLEHGPYLRNNSLAVPSNVLTKSHCGGYSDIADLKASFLFLESFENLCGREQAGTTNYPMSIPTSAVHLIRHPLDNILSRKHHGVMRRRQFLGWSEERLAPFNDTRQGLLAWCSLTDKNFWGEDPKGVAHISEEVVTLSKSVPCSSDFFRYTQWHNHAVALTKKLKLPTFTLHYEDYANDFQNTVESLFRFLRLPMVNDPAPFVAGKTYLHLFSEQEHKVVAELIHSLATPDCWALLRQYFPGSIFEDDDIRETTA